MSANSTGEKTEQPTPKKERDARKKGQVARSQEVVTSASLMAAIAYIWITWDWTFDRLVLTIEEVAGLTHLEFIPAISLATEIILEHAFAILAPLLLVGIIVDIFANYLQFGTIFAAENVKMKHDNISPIKGFKRIFSMKQLFEVFKSIVKILFLSVLLFFVLRDAMGPYVKAVACGLPCLTDVTAKVIGLTLLWSALAFIIVAVLDFIFQRWQHTKSLMMSKEDVKREFKESEGDPIIKGQRKQLAQELAMSDGAERAKKSSAVVINPTHLAVAIKYDPKVDPLPIVFAKGRNINAHHIRGAAEAAGVPIFKNIPLARTLFSDVMIDEYVPNELFDAVAEILVWVSHN